MPAVTESIYNRLKSSKAKMLLIGDGFVDEVWEIVSSRSGPKDYGIYNKMNQFAERILGSGTGGVGLELVKKRRAFGGFTANIGYAAARLGVSTALIGVYGENGIDPVFDQVDKLCEVYSLANPSTTHVFEFDDGKILMSHMESVMNVSWDRIVEKLGAERIDALIKESDILGVGYWSLVPAFDEIIQEICRRIPNDGKQRRFFFDFADFRKRDEASLNRSMSLLAELNDKVPMTLSVNEHEAAALFAMHNETVDDIGSAAEFKTERVRERIGLDELVIHTPRFAAAAAKGENPVKVPQVFCEAPVRSAGAGDTFNGGYIAARTAGLGISDSLTTANAAVSYFLNKGDFPGIEEIWECD